MQGLVPGVKGVKGVKGVGWVPGVGGWGWVGARNFQSIQKVLRGQVPVGAKIRS